MNTDDYALPILRDGTPLEYRFPFYIDAKLAKYVIPQFMSRIPPHFRVLWLTNGKPDTIQCLMGDCENWDYVRNGHGYFAMVEALNSPDIMMSYDVIIGAPRRLSVDIMQRAAECRTLIISSSALFYGPSRDNELMWCDSTYVRHPMRNPTRIKLSAAPYITSIEYHQKNFFLRPYELATFEYFQ